MSRKKSHFEGSEPFLEKILSTLRFEKIIKHIPENSKILDLGCGYNGNFLKKLCDKNHECIGLDISVDQKLNLSNTSLIEHDLNKKFPFADNTFDVVTSLANLEHLQFPDIVLDEVFRVLKPNGILLLTAPSIYAKPVLEFLSYRLHLISEDEIKDHKNYFCKKLLLSLCKKSGFSKIKHRYFQFFMNNFIKVIK